MHGTGAKSRTGTARQRADRTTKQARRESHLTSAMDAVRNVNQLIAREKDRGTLLRRACGILTETRGYRSAWIAAVDADGRIVSADESGIGAPFAGLREALLHGQWPACAQQALAGTDVTVLHHPKIQCGGCPLAGGYHGSAALAVALRYGQREYGVLTVALPRAEADVEEERMLVSEVAGDLALALHTLDLEAQHRATQAREAHVKQVLLAIRNVNQLIVHEDDPQRLIARACENLTETLGYHNAWIALLDGAGRTVTATAATGFDGQLEVLRERLARGELSACMRQALELDATIVVNDPSAECTDCPLSREYGGRARFARRLAFEGKTFGILAVSVPAGFAHDLEEQSLFDEVAGDLGFALHKIELQARLREADDRVRAKLNAILSPEGDVGVLSLADVLDIPSIQATMDHFLGLTGIGVAILDVQGKVLVATGWQDICTRFHRVHPETRRHCIESDTELSSGVEPGAFKFYRCKNNLWDVATPIMLKGRHAGNVFFGQFFFADETPDREVFLAQARQYGFDEETYLAAMERVPRWSRERVHQIMAFYAAFARQLSDLSYGNLKLARTLTQRDELLGRLGRNEERLRLALRATNDVVWDWDAVNDTQRWNEAGIAVFGWSDIVEAPQTAAWWVDRVHPEDRQRVHETFFAAVHNPATDRWRDEYRLRKADGAYAYVVDRGHILRDADGRAVRMIGAMLDITERKRAEEALQESETRFRFLVDYSYDLIWTLSSDGVFSYVSPSWKTRLGHEPSSMAGRAFQPMVHADDLAACEDYLSRVLAARSALPGPEYRVRHADGSWRWHEAGMTPVYAEDGSFMYFVGVSRDITERKRAEDDLRHSRHLLNATEALSAVGGWEWDVATQAMTWTDGTYRIHDLDPAAVPCGSPVHIERSLACYDPEDRPRIAEAFRRCLEKGDAYDLECGFTNAAGRRLRVRTMGQAIRENSRIVKVLGNLQDITERTRAEQGLKESEARFATLFRSSPMAAAISLLEDGRLVDVNAEFETLLGRAREECVGRTVLELGLWVDPGEHTTLVRKVREEGGAHGFECLLRRASGETLPVLMSAESVRIGEADLMLTMALDISQRKLAEEAMQREHQRLQFVVDGSGLGTWVWNVQTDETVFNETWAAMLGRTVSELTPYSYETWGRLVHPDDIAAATERLRRCATGETPDYECEFRMRHKDGRWVWILDRGRVMTHDDAGAPLSMFGTHLEISERKRAEEALRESEERFRAANEASLDALLLLRSERDATGKVRDFVFVDLNRRTEEMLRMSREQLLGRRLCEVLPINREAGFFEKYKRVVDTGVPLEEEFFLPETHVPAAWYSHQVVRVGDGVFICQRDIGERKRAEEERDKLQAQLLQAQKMEAIGTLAGGIAHDFNNLLQALLATVQAARLKCSDDRCQATFKGIEVLVRRGADLTRQLLLFARKEPVRTTTVDMAALLREEAAMLQRLLPENIEINVEAPTRTCPVAGDPTQLRQVITNLAVNARDAMAHGGHLTLTLAERDGEIAVSVRDTGVGMSEDVQQRIFDPFFSTKAPGKGTGLGLAVVWGIVKQHGGRISVQSVPGQGTVFEIVLPPATVEAEASAESESEEWCQPCGNGERILVVEDEGGTRAALGEILELLGFAVSVVGSAEEAGRLPAEPEFDLLLTDYLLPGANGLELAAGLAQRWPGLKVVVMSGYSPDDLARPLPSSRAAHYLEKPFDIRDLTRTLRAALAERCQVRHS